MIVKDKKNILLVEDEFLIAMGKQQELEEYGYTVQHVNTGEKAVEASRDNEDIDLILMDINLGRGMDGTEAVEAILKTRRVPVVLLSSHMEPKFVEKTENITSYGYVVKSSSITVLDASIKMALKLFDVNQKLWNEISEHKKTEKALRLSKEQYHLIDEASRDSIYSYDNQERFTHANSSLCKMLGLNQEQIIGKTHEELKFSKKQCEEWAELHNKVYETNSTVISGTEAPIPGSSSKYFEVVLNPIHDVNKQIIGIAGTTRDITKRIHSEQEKKKLQEQLLHADKLATIGGLSAGVAHELNNPLSNILGYAELIKGEHELEEEVGNDIDKIISASLHARKIVRELLVFSRQIPPLKSKVYLNTIIRDSIFFLKSQCKNKGTSLSLDLDSDLPDLIADPSQMNQLIVNLVVNSIHSISRECEGKIIIQTSFTKDRITLTIEDNGEGMSPEVRKQIFLPFFTTKEVGEGTGLGLSVVHGIVTSHSGEIQVVSQEGEGTRFDIIFPSTNSKQSL